MSFKVKLLNSRDSSFSSHDVVPASDSAAMKHPAILKLPAVQKRKFAPSKLAKCFIATVVAESLFVLVQHAILAPPTKSSDEAEVWFAGIMLINLVFFIYLAISAVWKENKFELYAFLAASALLTARVIFEYAEEDKGCEKRHTVIFCLISLIVVLCFQLALLVLGYFVADEMGWQFFRMVGADRQMKDMYTNFQAFNGTLKLETMLALLLIFTALFFSSFDNFTLGIIVACVMFVGELLWELLGFYAVKREHATSFKVFLVLGIVSPAYVAVFLVKYQEISMSIESEFVKLLVVASIALLNRIMLICFGVACYRKFGHGLKERLFDVEEGATRGRLPHNGSRILNEVV